MSISQRWELAKHKNLCFRCLDDSHTGVACPRSRTCGINECSKTHNRLLHRDYDKSQGYRASARTQQSNTKARERRERENKPSINLENTESSSEQVTEVDSSTGHNLEAYPSME